MTNKLSLPTEKVTWTINDFVKLHNQDKLIINKEYQRSEVWRQPKKQLLIDSILNDYDVGSIILRQKDDKWEILDGQQRLKAIFDFIEDKFPLPKGTENGEKYWNDLEPPVQWGQFMNRLVYTTKIYSIDDEITSTIFLRVQEGMPLIGSEKLNAMRGKFRNKIFEMSQHSFFRQTGVNEFRFAYRHLVAQVALEEIDNGISNHILKDSKFRNLREIYIRFKDDLPSKVFERIFSTLNFLENNLGSVSQIIKKKSDFVTIYLLTSYILQKYAIKGKEDSFRDFIVEFIREVEKETYMDNDEYYDYWVARSSSPDSKKQLEKRFEIILKKFLEYNPAIESKDTQREFDWGQRLTIYSIAYRKAKNDGKQEAECALCGKSTSLDNGSADHIKPYNLGGKTTVENGQWTCIHCNSTKGDKYSETN
jgi:5-methylcytosine-specific restriction endonuclease McrA